MLCSSFLYPCLYYTSLQQATDLLTKLNNSRHNLIWHNICTFVHLANTVVLCASIVNCIKTVKNFVGIFWNCTTITRKMYKSNCLLILWYMGSSIIMLFWKQKNTTWQSAGELCQHYIPVKSYSRTSQNQWRGRCFHYAFQLPYTCILVHIH